jgi:hypothetical protein
VIWERQQETVLKQEGEADSSVLRREGVVRSSLGIHASILIWRPKFSQSSLIDAASSSCYGSKDPLVSSVSTLFTTCEVVSGKRVTTTAIGWKKHKTLTFGLCSTSKNGSYWRWTEESNASKIQNKYVLFEFCKGKPNSHAYVYALFHPRWGYKFRMQAQWSLLSSRLDENGSMNYSRPLHNVDLWRGACYQLKTNNFRFFIEIIGGGLNG